MRRIEEQILVDDDFIENLSIAEDDLIEEYLDGNLTGNETEQFNSFFLNSSERKQKLSLLKNLRKHAQKADARIVEKPARGKIPYFNRQRLFSPLALRFALVILLIGGVGFGVWRVGFYQSDTDKGLAQLQIAYRGKRPFESRTTTNFGYAPLSDTRGDAPPLDANEKAQRRAEILLSDAAEDSADAKAHQALGLLYLAEKKYDAALNEFNAALKLTPDSAEFHNDLGAALLEKAKQSERETKADESFENLALALKSVNRALEIDSLLLEALFNKALILQKMQLTGEARQAWEKYLERDSESPWANEARRNLELLKNSSGAPKDKSRILQDFLESFRNKDDLRSWEIAGQTKELITGAMIESQLARKFLEADEQSRKEEASETLSAFSYLGELEKQNAADLYFTELANFYSETDPRQRQKLRKAHAELEEGYKSILQTDFKQALKNLSQSKELFISAGNSWESDIARFQIGYCLSQLGKLKESNDLLFSMAERCEKNNYHWLKSLIYGWIGSNYSNLGEHSKAIVYNRQALKTAEKTSDTYNIQRALNQLTNEYQKIGDLRQASYFSFQSIRLPNSYYLSPRQRFRNLNFATQVLSGMKLFDAAFSFGRENLNLVQNEIRDKWLSHSVTVQLGVLNGELRRYEEAYRDFEASLRIAETLPDKTKIDQLSARSFLSLANVQRQANECDAAIGNYNQAIRIYEKMQLSVNNYEGEKGKLLCYAAQKNDSAVTEAMPRLIKSFDSYRQNLREEERATFFNAEQDVYDTAIDYAYTNLRDAEQSFNYAENSRARSLLNLMRGNEEQPQPLQLAELRRQIPVNAQIVYYAVLTDKTLIWVISNTRFAAVEVSATRIELENKISTYTKDITGKSADENTDGAARELYRLLIEPIDTLLEKDKTICFVADKSLLRLPFASLVSPGANKYLIEDYAVLTAPSATVFIKETEIARKKSANERETILSIGNPFFSRAEYPKLADLPSAAREAEEIASIYETAKVFVGKKAVKKQIIDSFFEADIIHFAGHYVPNAKSPSFSKLLLTTNDSNKEGKDLTVEEITRDKLPRARLIILSACETGIEKFYNGEGMIGAARAFLKAEVPLVIGSQWAVDSEATAELMIKFHHYRKQRGLSSIAALRRAQIDLLTDEKSHFRQPFYWAGFLPIGGYVNY